MGDKVVKLQVGIHCSQRQLAEISGLDRDTVTKRLAAMSAAPSGKRGGHPVYRLTPDLLKGLLQSDDSGRRDPDKLEPYQRQAHYKAELDKMKLETEARELIPRIEVEQEQARLMRIVALMLDTLPDVLERDCGISGETLGRVERSIDDCRETLHKQLTDEEPEASAGEAVA
jgi:hypothetical protein